MSSLSVVPIEILEWITSVVTTSQQMRLWQCGDRILNIKLKNGGLKRTSLCWSGCDWMPWPKWYFTIFDDIVDVEWGMKLGESLCPTLELNLLPKTLKRLHLACEDVFIVLLQQNVNMNDMLPNLQSLYLSGSRMCEENLKDLPSNLIELHVNSPGGQLKTSRIFGDLPRRLERLTIGRWIWDESEHENDLPSQLISIDVYNIRCGFNWFSKLPRSLKKLKLGGIMFVPDYTTLPPQLEELSMAQIHRSSLPLLPQSLHTLEVTCGFKIPGELGPLLPKNLTKFVTQDDEALHHSELQKLPASLTDLDAMVSATHQDLLSFYRPETVTMRIRKGPFADQLNILPFPAKLRSLELTHINDGICAMLPPCLQELTILKGGLITSKGASKLPRSLTFLQVHIEMFDCNQTMSYLPRISEFHLDFRKSEEPICDLDESCISYLVPSSSPSTSYNPECIPAGTDINAINHQLTVLGVGVGYQKLCRPLIKQSLFDALSKFINLTTLRVYMVENISCDWLCLIPRTVTDLTLSYLTSYPNASQLRTLPKCLQYLCLGVREKCEQVEWNEETIRSLPRSLRVCQINDHFPTNPQHMHECLPPNLHVYGKDFESSALDRLYGAVPDWPS